MLIAYVKTTIQPSFLVVSCCILPSVMMSSLFFMVACRLLNMTPVYKVLLHCFNCCLFNRIKKTIHLYLLVVI